MKNQSKLSRYKDPLKRMKDVDNFNKETYRIFTFRLHKQRDADLIKTIDKRTVSLPKLIREWYKGAK